MKSRLSIALIALFFATTGVASATPPEGLSVGLGAGAVFYEGDEQQESGQAYELKVSYQLDEKISVNGFFTGLPYLNNRDLGPDREHQLDDSTWGLMWGLGADYHLGSADSLWDPSVGPVIGITRYGDDVEDGDQTDLFGGINFGLGYPIAADWSARGDYRVVAAGEDTEINHHVLLSLVYHMNGSGLDGAMAHSALKPVYFAFDKSELSAESKNTLDSNAAWLKDNSRKTALVEGNCDERGTTEYNYALGERRAKAVADYYRTQGVPAERLSTVSFGEDQPVDTGHNEAAWSKNRRADTKIKQ